MADDDQPTQVLSGAPTPPAGGATTLEPHEPRLADGGPGSGGPPQPPVGYGGDGSGDQWGDDGDGDGPDRRLAILGAVIGILVVVILFLVLRPGDDNDTPTPTATPVATAPAAADPAATAEPTPTNEATPTPEATPDDAPKGDSGGATVDGSDGSVADAPLLTGAGVTKFTANQGDTVTFQVRNDASTTQEVHVHGYDKAFNVSAGATKTISFKATITGIFEIEFEETGTQIGELTVEP